MFSALIRFEVLAGVFDVIVSIYIFIGFVDFDLWGLVGVVMKYCSLLSMMNVVVLEILELGGRFVKLIGSGFVSNCDLFCKFGEIYV